MKPGCESIRASAFLLTAVLVAGLNGCASTTARSSSSLFYPPPPQRPRIQYLKKFADGRDVEGRENAVVRFLVGDQSGERRLRKPTGLAAHDGVIYVADTGWDTVLALDLKNGVFDTIRDEGAGKLRVPVAIAIDSQGNKFVADTERNQVVQFDQENEFVYAYGEPEKIRPAGVAVDDKLLYVTNRSEHRVEIFDRATKKSVRTIGEFGDAEGQFNIPTSLSLDRNGHLFVTDAANFRIQEFDRDGKHVKSFGLLGDGPGTFARPRGHGVDREGHLYSADAAFENVQIWDTTNAEVLLAFGGPGVGPGQMYLPASVCISYDLVPYFTDLVDPDFTLQYVVLVANNYGPSKIGVYGFVNPKNPSQYVEHSNDTGRKGSAE